VDSRRPARRASLLLASLVAGCATYTARPLDSVDPVARYHARRLDDSTLLAALDSIGVGRPSGAWRDWQLAAAAWVLRPERDRMLAEIHAAEAGRISAGARPQPEITTETEIDLGGGQGESRFGFALGSVFTLELGGKRGARLGRANAALLAAQARADAEARELRGRVRARALAQEHAERRWRQSEAELVLLDSVIALTRSRFAEGGASASEVARAQADREEWAMEVTSRLQAYQETRAALAAEVGVPEIELARVEIAVDQGPRCAAPEQGDSLERLALVDRPEVRLALADYQVAEAEVRIAVANSWPDLALGPGLFLDHGINKWTVAFGLPSLPLNRNRGPIAEAEAQREVAARRVAEVQELVIADVEQALAGCAAAEAAAASLAVTGAEERLALADQAYQRGEVGRLDVTLAHLELVRASRRFGEAALRLTDSGLELEHAVGIWSGAPALSWWTKGGL